MKIISNIEIRERLSSLRSDVLYSLENVNKKEIKIKYAKILTRIDEILNL